MGQRSALIMSVVVALVFGFVMAQHFEDEAARQRTLAVANGMIDELEKRAARPQPMPVQEAAAMKHDDEKEMVDPVEGDADGVVCNGEGAERGGRARDGTGQRETAGLHHSDVGQQQRRQNLPYP